MHLFKVRQVSALFCVIFAISAVALIQSHVSANTLFSGCGGELVEPTNSAFEAQVVELVNQQRLAQRLPPLKLSTELAYAARYHAADMVQDRYFNHDSFDRSADGLLLACSWFERMQVYYPLTQAAENIAAGYATPQDVVNGWLNSVGHRQNLLSANWETGVGYHQSRWVQDFSRRDGVFPVVINREAATTTTAEVTLYIYGDWAEMRLRNDGGEWSVWQAFTSEPTWQLNPSAGLRTVEVELRKGTAQTISSDTIELTLAGNPTETPAPTETPTAVPTSER
jgi:uncharacterized protein YkwD